MLLGGAASLLKNMSEDKGIIRSGFKMNLGLMVFIQNKIYLK